MTPLLALVLIVTLAFTVEATAGFGATVITLTLASGFLPLDEVLAAIVPVNLALSLLLCWRNRAHIDGGVLRQSVARWMLPGVLVGLTLFSLHEQVWIKAVFGALVLGLAALELGRMLFSGQNAGPLPEATRIAALLGAGVIHGLFSCGGPLLVWVVGRELPDKGRFRATLSATWSALNLLLVLRYLLAGTITASSLTQSAALVPALIVGLALGQRLHVRLDPRRFRLGVFGLLLLAGASLVVRTLGA